MVMAMAAEYLAETLARAGVERVYGVVGDSLNGFTDALRRQGGAQGPGQREGQTRLQNAMRRGFQTREAEMDLERVLPGLVGM